MGDDDFGCLLIYAIIIIFMVISLSITFPQVMIPIILLIIIGGFIFYQIARYKKEKRRGEEEARLRREQEERRRLEEQARLKREQEERQRLEEQARLKREQEERQRLEEQTRLKREQEERQQLEEQAIFKREQEERQRLEERVRLITEQEENKQLEEQKRFRQKLVSQIGIDSTTLTIDSEYSEIIRKVSETYLYKILCDKYGAKNIVWLNESAESYAPYDFALYNNNGDIIQYIECKGTIKNKPTFYLTDNEWHHFLKNNDIYQLYRVFNLDSEPDFLCIENLFDSLLTGEVVPYLQKPTLLKEKRVSLTYIPNYKNE